MSAGDDRASADVGSLMALRRHSREPRGADGVVARSRAVRLRVASSSFSEQVGKQPWPVGMQDLANPTRQKAGVWIASTS